MIKFIDLFAGMGGARVGFEAACEKLGIQYECVFTSEIKEHATKIYKHNFNNEHIHGDITKISACEIPSFDYLLAGFPCQAFSTAGKKHGFNDTRGTLFFDVARIIKEKHPKGFLLENVEGLVTHDRESRKDKTGRTLNTILLTLKGFGYNVTYKVLDSSCFGTPQKRKRVYIIGHKDKLINLDSFPVKKSLLKSILESGLPCSSTKFKERLLALYSKDELYGKSIKDKRGGAANIHSWDLELKGSLSSTQKEIMSLLLKERRKKHWAERKQIKWMDGMPLTLEEIHTFYTKLPKNELGRSLDDLVDKKYLKFEFPKKQITDAKGVKHRVHDEAGIKGYNIVAGKLSFELSQILNPNDVVNTIVATEVDRIGVVDLEGIRNLSTRECLRIFGFPHSYKVNIEKPKLYDLIGNTVALPVVQACSERLLEHTSNCK